MKHKISILLPLIAVLASSGCFEPSTKQVIGTYSLSLSNVTDKIVLLPDGEFRQELTYVGGPTWKLTNRWELVHRGITLHESYLAYDGDAKVAVLASPKLVAMCTFIWEGNGFSRRDGELFWEKSP